MAKSPDNAGRDTDTAAEAAEPRYPGKGFRIAEYVIIDTLGHGSMATVFLARDATGHEVAIKLFQEGPGVSPTLLERFKREAEASKKLRRHPNIMKVYATGKEGPYHFIVMEPIKNSKTFEDAIETTLTTPASIVGIIVKIARALHYAHSRNIVHRDVKPTNIMIDEFGEPLLTDFGVAALIDWPSFTMTGALTGTPLYMSPEQARAERVGPSSDIYSLGVVLYEALTGVLPYSAQHSSPVKNVLEAVKDEVPRRPRAIRKDISPDLEAVILKAIEKKPDDRYSDAEEMACDLDRALSGHHVQARLFSQWERIMSVAHRHRKAIFTVVVIVLATGAAGYTFRRELLKERYEKLLSSAQLRNFTTRMIAQNTAASDTSSQTPGAWYAVRMGRRAMSVEDWTRGVAEFQSAVNLSDEAGDARTKAMAQLDQARCEALLDNTTRAQSLYRDILQNPDASPALADFAQLEAVILSLISGDRAQAVDILSMRGMPTPGPMRSMLECLTGDRDIASLQAALQSMPPRLQNDAHMAAAIRYRVDGNAKGFANELRSCMQSSSPPSEWPAPLARRLRTLPD